MKGKFYCKSCGAELTGELEIKSLKDPAVAKPDLADREPVCAVGNGYKSFEPLMDSGDNAAIWPLQFAPQFWLNLDDVSTTTKQIGGVRRLIGCCGVSGLDGPNRGCVKCGTEVGTEQSDCFTPLIFVPEPENTEFRKTEQ